MFNDACWDVQGAATSSSMDVLCTVVLMWPLQRLDRELADLQQLGKAPRHVQVWAHERRWAICCWMCALQECCGFGRRCGGGFRGYLRHDAQAPQMKHRAPPQGKLQLKRADGKLQANKHAMHASRDCSAVDSKHATCPENGRCLGRMAASHARIPLGMMTGVGRPLGSLPMVASATALGGSSFDTRPDGEDLKRLQEQAPGPFCLFVGDLAFEASGEAVEQLFALRFSSVLEAYVISERPSGRSRGYGFVKLSDILQAQRAIAEMNSTLFMGRRIRVSAAGPKPPPGSYQQPGQLPRGPIPMLDRLWQGHPVLGNFGGGAPNIPGLQPHGTGAAPHAAPMSGPTIPPRGGYAPLPPRPNVLSIVGSNARSGVLTLFAPGLRLSWLCSHAEIVGEVRLRQQTICLVRFCLLCWESKG